MHGLGDIKSKPLLCHFLTPRPIHLSVPQFSLLLLLFKYKLTHRSLGSVFDPQLEALFHKILEALGGNASLKEEGYCGHAFKGVL